MPVTPSLTRSFVDHEHAHLSLRAEPERPSPSRPCAVGAHELRHGAAQRRTISAPYRGYRYDTVPVGVRDGHLRRPRLAGDFLGRTRTQAVGAPQGLHG